MADEYLPDSRVDASASAAHAQTNASGSDADVASTPPQRESTCDNAVEGASEPPDHAITPPSPTLTCWRCEKTVTPVAGVCPVCKARLLAALPTDHNAPSHRGVLSLLGYMGGLLLTSIVFGVAGGVYVFVQTDGGEKEFAPDAISIGIQFAGSAVFAIISLIAWVHLRPSAVTNWPKSHAIACWLLSIPALALMVCLSFAYGHALQNYLNPPESLIAQDFNADTPHWMVFLLMCAAPGITEELFFRQVSMRILHPVMSWPMVLTTTSIMFGFAHIGNPLGLPYLIVAGFFLGALRIHSGGLLLPILAHTAHNAAVVWGDQLQLWWEQRT